MDRLPCWEEDGCALDTLEDRPVPEMPGWLLDSPDSEDEPPPLPTGAWETEPEVRAVAAQLHIPLAERFLAEWEAVQRHTARMWRVISAMHTATGARSAEFVGDDLALLTNTHPRTGATLLTTAVSACEVPMLLTLVETAQLSERHARALLDEAARWTDTPAQAQQVLELTLARCQARVTAGLGWPTPGQLRARLRTTALLLDLSAVDTHRRSVAERRSASAFPTGVGAACLSLQGPQLIVAQMMDAIRARAAALGKLPGDTRTHDQRLFDAAHDLLCADADGGRSRVPALDQRGQPVTITVRGLEVSLLMPYSVAQGGDLELAELPGLGPVLPSTARELLAQAQHVRRIAVHAQTGQVIAVDDRRPGPNHPRSAAASPAVESAGGPTDGAAIDGPAGHDEAPAAPAAVPPQVRTTLDRLRSTPIELRDLTSSSYRVASRLRRLVERRDRTCSFPGCTVPGHWCDLDHREPWPHGPTSDENLHCLCRRHHRAKQGYFTVTLDNDGNTVWTTPDGRRYRRPPPTY